MNDQLEKALIVLIDKAVVGLDESVDFLSAEIPATIGQLLMWYGVSSLVYALIGLGMLYLSYLAAKKPKEGKKNWMWDYNERKEVHEFSDLAPFGILLVLPAVIGLSGAVTHFMEALKIWIAPNVWLMEYAATLSK